MESKTKTKLKPETIETLVKAQFGTSVVIDEIVPLTAGYFNTAYAIHFANLAPNIVLRIAPHPDQPVLTYEKDLMRRERVILETIQRIEDIPYVPALLGYDFSRQLINRDYIFIEKLSGVALSDVKETLAPGNLQAIEHEVGSYVARLGQVKGEFFGYFEDGPGHGSDSWRTAFIAILEAIIHDGETLGVELPVSYDVLRVITQKHADHLDEISEPAFVHWDLWAGNVFVKPQNGKYGIEGIIDWERAFWGDPDAETAVSGQFYGPEFMVGYGKQLAKSGPEAIRQSLYRLYLWLVLLIETKVRDYAPDYLPWAREQFQNELNFLNN
jgi:aminoglycoside phosphotransferase (APT) family kinase protein